VYAEVVKGSDAKLPDDIVAELANPSGLYQMGILYFWIFDKSPGRLRTLEVIDRRPSSWSGCSASPTFRPAWSRKEDPHLVRSVAQGS